MINPESFIRTGLNYSNIDNSRSKTIKMLVSIMKHFKFTDYLSCLVTILIKSGDLMYDANCKTNQMILVYATLTHWSISSLFIQSL